MGILDGIRGLDELTLDNRRLFLRLDFDLVPAKPSALDEERLSRALPSIEHALKAGARLIVASRIGDSKRGGGATLEPLAERLSERLKSEVFLPDDCVGDAARKVVQDLRAGQLCLLENLGAYAEEQQNEESFARKLASFADVYVNDALSDSEHAYASLDALPRIVRERGMGLALAAELRALAGVADSAAPFTAIIGGGAVLERLELAETLLERCNVLLAAGTLGNTLLAARGANLQESRVDRTLLARGRALLSRARDRGVELVLPVDLLVAESTAGANSQVVPASNVPSGTLALDIGPKTLELYGERVQKARTALWCGAFGAPRSPTFASNITEFCGKFASGDVERVRVVVGDDTRAAVLDLPPELKSTIGFVSAGGRASIELIKKRRLPGIEALRSGAP